MHIKDMKATYVHQQMCVYIYIQWNSTHQEKKKNKIFLFATTWEVIMLGEINHTVNKNIVWYQLYVEGEK